VLVRNTVVGAKSWCRLASTLKWNFLRRLRRMRRAGKGSQLLRMKSARSRVPSQNSPMKNDRILYFSGSHFSRMVGKICRSCWIRSLASGSAWVTV